MKKFFLILTFGLVGSLILSGCVPKPRVKGPAEQLFKELEIEEKKEKRVPEEEKKELERELKKTEKKEIIRELAKEEEKRKGPALKEVIPFEEEGEGVASKYERPIEAERRAEEDALSKALKKTGVIDIYYGFSDIIAQYEKTEYRSIVRYLYTWSSGIAAWEKVGKPEFTTTEDGGTKCRVKIRGEIHLKGKSDPGYEVRLDWDGKKLGLNKEVYFPKDEVTSVSG